MVRHANLLLVAALRRGDPAAFDRAYEEHRERVYGFLARLSGRVDVAQDLFQETFLKLAKNATSLRDDTDLAAWLFTVARNEFLSYRRRVGARPREDAEPDEPVYAASSSSNPERQVTAQREIARIEHAIASLPDMYREVLLLVAVEGLDTDQACMVLALKPDALRQRLSRARAALAEKLEQSAHRPPSIGYLSRPRAEVES
ncbi:MAG: RNA polymerase sigma factor [Polyangiaceae bacterium]